MSAKLSFIYLGGRFKVQYRNTTGVFRSSPEEIHTGFYDPIFAEDFRWYLEALTARARIFALAETFSDAMKDCAKAYLLNIQYGLQPEHDLSMYLSGIRAKMGKEKFDSAWNNLVGSLPPP